MGGLDRGAGDENGPEHGCALGASLPQLRERLSPGYEEGLSWPWPSVGLLWSLPAVSWMRHI